VELPAEIRDLLPDGPVLHGQVYEQVLADRGVGV
jgi:hypothetical protein